MKWWHYLLSVLVLVFLGIQFVPNDLPEVELQNPGDIMLTGMVNDEVAGLLKNSCYDCHSNESKYPWYSHIAPSSWLVTKDIREGREELNFSQWNSYDLMEQLGKLDDIIEEVSSGNMPMGIYTLMHSSAKLSDAQRELIVAWAEESMDKLVEEDEADFEENEN
ncbi:heme-binding domain-containing protein [Fontibacter flavus]|uniref:Heme-binding domain-containing protein n=1 Tax=Fontibacter flavus TaxID=654838 RepID=A0ABV6FX32_9BACT